MFDAATKLQKKPGNMITLLMTGNFRALAAYHGNEIDYAVVYWDKAIKLLNASDIQISQALFNKGVALGRLEKTLMKQLAVIRRRHQSLQQRC